MSSYSFYYEEVQQMDSIQIKFWKISIQKCEQICNISYKRNIGTWAKTQYDVPFISNLIHVMKLLVK